jgi:hypothetical protein
MVFSFSICFSFNIEEVAGAPGYGRSQTPKLNPAAISRPDALLALSEPNSAWRQRIRISTAVYHGAVTNLNTKVLVHLV